jgi:hypothetical protein
MDWLWSADSTAARFVLTRGIALIYVVAFANAALQFPALLGEHGLLPAPRFLRRVRFRRAPSLFHLHYSDRALVGLSWAGVLLALALVLGVAEAAPLPVTMAAWAVLWALYLSIVNIGQEFYSFGWETLLLEAGVLAIFLGNDSVAPPFLVILLFRWLAFRLEFGAGLIKLRGDPCWRALTCLDYHHETQPLPNPASWAFHHLPRRLHRVEAIVNFVAQLAMPFLLFAPQPLASIGALVMITGQVYLVLSGNYAWLNWLTIVVTAAGLSDAVLRTVVPLGAAPFGPAPAWFAGAVLAVTALIVILSYWPTRNLLSRHQAMNASFDPLHLVNTYGAFGSVTRLRHEIVARARPRRSSRQRRSGASTSSRPSRATSGGWRPRSRPITCASTGSCGSRRSRPPMPSAGSSPSSSGCSRTTAPPLPCCAARPSRRTRPAMSGAASTATGSRVSVCCAGRERGGSGSSWASSRRPSACGPLWTTSRPNPAPTPDEQPTD